MHVLTGRETREYFHRKTIIVLVNLKIKTSKKKKNNNHKKSTLSTGRTRPITLLLIRVVCYYHFFVFFLPFSLLDCVQVYLYKFTLLDFTKFPFWIFFFYMSSAISAQFRVLWNNNELLRNGSTWLLMVFWKANYLDNSRVITTRQ